MMQAYWISKDYKDTAKIIQPMIIRKKPMNIGHSQENIVIRENVNCCLWIGARTVQEHRSDRFLLFSPLDQSMDNCLFFFSIPQDSQSRALYVGNRAITPHCSGSYLNFIVILNRVSGFLCVLCALRG